MTMARAASVVIAILGFASLRELLASSGRAQSSPETVRFRRVEQDHHTPAVDKSTGLGNEHSFHLELERTVKQAQRHANTVTLSLVDVDAYEPIRETYGENVAERMMAELATFIGGRRADDRTFRLNGGRFAIILPYTTAPEIFPLMEHLGSETEQSELGTTVTIGTAHIGPCMDSAQLLHRTRAALAEAHLAGGNTVVTFDAAAVSDQFVPIANPA